ncbi:exopolysaccharide biosynthesis polyprenyl glycosylphosphotransferase [Christiangramia echinicola]|uniref:Putative colanic acid biosysnthesis UDP-glucose lipid carrier transferase n=1 Tax=Christiangramia echinicola TaxID=279359 RepID=A0A1H1LV77_9FLAO|nr:exopolysaccharide biosynthesis polyprenyl glycosylphosphotransferase [Christiangramia echinicola]SDR77925.1 putative colanic acid biosysnthesis UDP-glucose lipid carrier transferase [Christiangramia echinicola]
MKRSDLIIPISIVVHLIIIDFTLRYYLPDAFFDFITIIFYSFGWLLVAYFMDFYPTARKESFFEKFHRFLQVFLLFSLAYFTILAFKGIEVYARAQFYILGHLFINLLLFRILFFYTRNKWRLLGGNSVSVVVIGRDSNLKKIRSIFDTPELGYRYFGYFHKSASHSPTYLGEFEEAFEYILNNNIDEIYCLASQLNKSQLHEVIGFADNNLKKVKIIPDNKEIFTRAMDVELFNFIPILNLRKSPLETPVAGYGKRIFDIIFSSLVILGLLSWLVPLMYVLIKLESPGPLFFKQKRSGLNNESFYCFKFRSMTVNKDSDKLMASKGDARITKIGAFIRKTSIDELPQFFNVFLGHMSVVGPRPHMESHTDQYRNSVDKYLVRHYAKPGITGLAQVKGYRGEILEPRDIINRTRLDIFYLEKWSALMDMKIIYATVANAIQGEDKAY